MAKLRNKDSTENWSHKNDYPIEEVWNTYHTLARLIVPRLQAFKALEKHGYCPDFKGMREWNCAIQKMIDAFELMKYANTYSVCFHLLYGKGRETGLAERKECLLASPRTFYRADDQAQIG